MVLSVSSWTPSQGPPVAGSPALLRGALEDHMSSEQRWDTSAREGTPWMDRARFLEHDTALLTCRELLSHAVTLASTWHPSTAVLPEAEGPPLQLRPLPRSRPHRGRRPRAPGRSTLCTLAQGTSISTRKGSRPIRYNQPPREEPAKNPSSSSAAGS